MVDRRRAVIFDLWDTLVVPPAGWWGHVAGVMAQLLGIESERFRAQWHATADERMRGSVRGSLDTLARTLGVAITEEQLSAIDARRIELSRSVFHARPGAEDVLRELKRRGYRLGLISDCADDVPTLWPQTTLAGCFDVAVFSCSVGYRKPDPRIYEIACEQLGVRPQDCLYIGDGSSDELNGATRTGMRAVQLAASGERPPWAGLVVPSLHAVLDLLGPSVPSDPIPASSLPKASE